MHLETHKSKENGMVVIGGGVGTGEDCNQRRRNFSQTDKFKSYIEQGSDYNNNNISWNIIPL